MSDLCSSIPRLLAVATEVMTFELARHAIHFSALRNAVKLVLGEIGDVRFVSRFEPQPQRDGNAFN